MRKFALVAALCAALSFPAFGTLTTSSAPPTSYIANGATTVFAFPYKFFATSDLVVTVTDTSGIVSTKTLGTDYTVSGANASAGGSVTFTTAPTSGYTVTLSRSVPLTQPTNLRTVPSAPAIENALDRLAAQIQQVQSGVANPVSPSALTNATSVTATGSSTALQLQDWFSFCKNPKAWGALGDNSHDDTVAVQSAITAAGSGDAVCIPKGKYKITSTLTASNVSALRFAGTGSDPTGVNGTAFLWAGNNSTPMFKLDDVGNSVFQGFAIVSSSTAPLAVGIQSVNGAGVSVTPTHDRFVDIFMNGSNSTGLDKGFQFSTGAGGDANNSDMVFDSVQIANYTTAAWSFESTQSIGHQFFGCSFQGNNIGASGVLSITGGLWWYAGHGGGNTAADFNVMTSTVEGMAIHGFDSEGSSRLLLTGGPSGAYGAVLIEGVRWTSNGLNVDNRAIKMQVAGPLVLVGNHIGSDVSKALEVWLNIGGSGSAVAIGNNIYTSLANPFTGQPTLITQLGNSLNSSASLLTGQITPALFASTKNRGTITLAAGTGTATVTSGTLCTCTDTTANVSVKCAVATTTLTATGTGTDVISYLCF